MRHICWTVACEAFDKINFFAGIVPQTDDRLFGANSRCHECSLSRWMFQYQVGGRLKYHPRNVPVGLHVLYIGDSRACSFLSELLWAYSDPLDWQSKYWKTVNRKNDATCTWAKKPQPPTSLPMTQTASFWTPSQILTQSGSNKRHTHTQTLFESGKQDFLGIVICLQSWWGQNRLVQFPCVNPSVIEQWRSTLGPQKGSLATLVRLFEPISS